MKARYSTFATKPTRELFLTQRLPKLFCYGDLIMLLFALPPCLPNSLAEAIERAEQRRAPSSVAIINFV